MSSSSDAKVRLLEDERDRLAKKVEELIPKVERTREKSESTFDVVGKAEAKLREAEQAIEDCSETSANAAAELSGAMWRVKDATAAVDEVRFKVRQLGGTGAGTGEKEPPPPAGGEALSNLEDSFTELKPKDLKPETSSRDLDEVRKLSRPPQVVRRALELVHTLLKIADGESDPFRPAGNEVDWSELQAMIASPVFVKRVVAMKPLALSLKPSLLQQCATRWPGLLEAVGIPAAVAGPKGAGAGWKGLKKAAGGSRSIGSLKDKLAGAVAAGAAQATSAEAPAGAPSGSAAAPAATAPAATAEGGAPASEKAKPKGGNVLGTRLAAAIAAAQAEAKPDGPALTVEAVEYASRPCGVIFRWCATVMNRANKIAHERRQLQAELDAKLKELLALRSELSATDEAQAKLTEEDALKEAARSMAAKLVDAARAEHRSAERTYESAQTELDEARKAAEAAAARATKTAADEQRKREEMARRKRDKLEAERLAQEAIEKDLAGRTPEAINRKGAWVFEHKLPYLRPLEFMANAAALPADAAVSLARVAKELQAEPTLKLHIAGHVKDDEDPKLSSQRAQAVGAALIALGAMPSRLRAKGYGATVTLTAQMKIRHKLKSERRVGIHAISELCTRTPVEFASRDSVLSETGETVTKEVADLLNGAPRLRVSIEGHTDDRGDAQQNAMLSVMRAQAVSKHLQSLGIDSSRLVAHGFGSTLPLLDNTSEENRARNRRVQFLVIPDVSR
jgi:outer membrane protein OmpA-like peptidoglycan-associated protein